MSGFLEGMASKALWDGIKAGARTMWGKNGIKITSPAPQETLSDGEPMGSGHSFRVRGALKRLPKGHEIWLLTQDEKTGLIWPQGFFMVQFNPQLEAWMGKIYGGGTKNIRIIAVVAPPTSQDYFRYFQTVGDKHQYQYEPLKRIPAECRNIASVQAFVP